MCFRLSIAALAILVSGVTGWSLVRQDQELPGGTNRPFMQAKMDHAKSILEGLALENFDGIQTSAQNLILLSHESAWNVLQSPDYIEMSSEFRGSVNRLKEAAKSQNLDGATIAWFEVTLNCVRCHKHLRHKRHIPSGGQTSDGTRTGDGQ